MSSSFNMKRIRWTSCGGSFRKG